MTTLSDYSQTSSYPTQLIPGFGMAVCGKAMMSLLQFAGFGILEVVNSRSHCVKRTKRAASPSFKSVMGDNLLSCAWHRSCFNKVYVDQELAYESFIAFNAGTHRDVIETHFSDYRKLVDPRILHLTQPLVSCTTK